MDDVLRSKFFFKKRNMDHAGRNVRMHQNPVDSQHDHDDRLAEERGRHAVHGDIRKVDANTRHVEKQGRTHDQIREDAHHFRFFFGNFEILQEIKEQKVGYRRPSHTDDDA